MHMCVLVTQSCLTLCDPTDCGLPGSLSMELSRQEYWSGLSFASPRYLPDSGVEPGSPALQADSLPFESLGKPPNHYKLDQRNLCEVSVLFDINVKSAVILFYRCYHCGKLGIIEGHWVRSIQTLSIYIYYIYIYIYKYM